MTEQERAKARAMALDVVNGTAEAEWGHDWYITLSRALLDADQRITDLTRINSDVVDINTEACNRADDAEAQLAACREALAFYGDPSTYEEETAGTPNASGIYETTSVPIFDDHGDLARRALSDGGSET